jgi:TPR repeat protein
LDRFSIPQALKFYQKGSDAGSHSARKKAQRILEIREEFYNRARETEKSSPADSFKNRLIGATMGHSGAKLLLAEAYANGIGTKPSRSLAFSLWESAARDDADRAYLPLGLCYAYGFGTRFDFDKALKALSIADKRGERNARREVQRLLKNKKLAIAKKLYSTAMRLIYLGKFDIAKRYLDAASDLELPKAIYTLGCLHEFGKGTPINKKEAYRLYDVADATGFTDERAKRKFTILKMLKK